MLRIGEAVLGIGLLILVLTDAIQTVVVARHARAIPLLSRTLLGGGWRLFASIVRIACPDRRRQGWLGIYGPLVLLVLLGAWASGLILAFALLQFSIVRAGGVASAGFATELYFSAASFFHPWREPTTDTARARSHGGRSRHRPQLPRLGDRLPARALSILREPRASHPAA